MDGGLFYRITKCLDFLGTYMYQKYSLMNISLELIGTILVTSVIYLIIEILFRRGLFDRFLIFDKYISCMV